MPRFFRALGAGFHAVIGPGVTAFIHEMGWKTRAERERAAESAALLAKLLPPPEYVAAEDSDRVRSWRKRSAEHERALAYVRQLDRSGGLDCSFVCAISILEAHFRMSAAA